MYIRYVNKHRVDGRASDVASSLEVELLYKEQISYIIPPLSEWSRELRQVITGTHLLQSARVSPEGRAPVAAISLGPRGPRDGTGAEVVSRSQHVPSTTEHRLLAGPEKAASPSHRTWLIRAPRRFPRRPHLLLSLRAVTTEQLSHPTVLFSHESRQQGNR